MTQVRKKFPASDKLKELQTIFDQEAKKFGVYSLDDRFVERAVNPERPSVIRGRKLFSYAPGTTRIPEGRAPPIYQRSHAIKAVLEIGAEPTEGVIVAEGGSAGGYARYVADGELVYDYNFFDKNRYKVTSSGELPSGNVLSRSSRLVRKACRWRLAKSAR